MASTVSSGAASNQPVVEIGLYVALASAVLLLMAAQHIFRAARRHVWWFPCEGTLLSLNAGTLSVLAVAIKLPNDLTTPMEGPVDQLSKLSGSALVCAIMAAGMPSLGNMKQEELWSNMAALGLLVLTMVVNVSMQIRSGVISSFVGEHVMLLASMALLFTVLCTLALAIPAMASDVHDTVHSRHHRVMNVSYDDRSLSNWEHLSKEAPTTWMMAVTSDLQYVVARSPIAASTGIIMTFSVLVFALGIARSNILQSPLTSLGETSVYKWTTFPISILQAATVFFCMCPSIIRCWRAVLYSGYTFANFSFSLEPFWQKSIVDFKFKPVAIEPTDPKKRQLRRMVQIWKERLLDCFQCVELIFVQMSRVTSLAFSWLQLLQKNVTLPYQTKCGEKEPGSDTLQLHGAMVWLDGENPQKLWEATRTYWAPVSMLIDKGKKAEIGKLAKLLEEHSAEDGDFSKRVRNALATSSSREGDQVKVLSWSLTIVTLLAVMMSLEWEAAGKCHESQEAMDAYTQALDMVALVDKHFSVPKKPWEGATQAVWAHLEARSKWLHIDLRSLAHHHESALSKLEEIARELLPPPSSSASHFHSTSASIAAHCLLHVIESLQQLNHSDHLMQTTRALLANVLAACLTNFPVAVHQEINKASHKGHSSNLQHALYLLGKGQQVWQHLAWSQASIASSLHGSIQAWIQPL